MLRKTIICLLLINLLLPTLSVVCAATENESYTNSDSKIKSNAAFWMKEGIFAEYTFKSSGICVNDTYSFFKGNYSADFKWVCEETNGSFAKLLISFSVATENGTNLLSTNVLINLDNRTTFFLNGTSIGETRLWSIPHPKPSEPIIMYAADQLNNSTAIVNYPKITGYCATPQGAQDVYRLQGDGLIRGFSSFIDAFYDVDTGVMVDCYLDSDPTLASLGISDTCRNGRQEFMATNINLGPHSTIPDAQQIPVIILIAAILSSIPLSLGFHHLRKKNMGKLKKAKRKICSKYLRKSLKQDLMSIQVEQRNVKQSLFNIQDSRYSVN